MNIAFIWNKPDKNDEWSTPGGIGHAMRTNGINVDFYDLRYSEDVSKLIRKKSDYTAVAVWQAGTVPNYFSEVWKKDVFKSTLMIAESGDDPQIMMYNLGHTLPADVILTPDVESDEYYKKRGKKSYWFTHWGDESVWKQTPQVDTGIVSSTAGFRHGMWSSCMTLLTQELGDSFINPRITNHKYLTVQENVELYSRSEIVVQVSSNKEITRRLFEAAICERTVIADRLNFSKRLDSCLVENEHIVLYDSPEECLEKVRWLLNNSTTRKKIAENSYQHVKLNHSADARARQLIAIIEENSN
jgi:hypothetical protein